MGNSKILIYDGSFNGFLTAVYIAFEKSMRVTDIRSNAVNQNGLFSETEIIFTDVDKAKRVWNGIQKKSNTAIKNIYFSYLSEYEGVEHILYQYIVGLYKDNYENDSETGGVLGKIIQLSKNSARSKERIESSLVFELSLDEVYVATVKPDGDVLPLISKHFRSRLPHQPWIIYDLKREYGIFYNLERVEIISLNLNLMCAQSIKNTDLFVEMNSQNKDYCFENITIKSCITKKVHSQKLTEQHQHHLNEKEAV